MIPWGAAILALAGLLASNAGNISTILGFAAVKSKTELQHETLEVFARKSSIIYAGYDMVNQEVGLVYFIESHPCTDYEVKYSIGNEVIFESAKTASICEDLPELRTGTTTVRTIVVDPDKIRPNYFTVNGQLIESDTANVLIQWKFKLEDGSFGYHTMSAAIPLEN